MGRLKAAFYFQSYRKLKKFTSPMGRLKAIVGYIKYVAYLQFTSPMGRLKAFSSKNTVLE